MIKFKPWDKWYNIPPGGDYAAHVKRGDAAVDFGLPKDTPIYTVFDEQKVVRATFNWDKDKYGVRNYVRVIELKDGKPTGYEVQFWHVNKVLVKNGIYKGRVQIALSGNTGAAGAPLAGYHCHLPYYVNGVRQDITLIIFELFMPGEIKKLQDQIDFYKNSDFDKAKQVARLTAKLDVANDQITELKSRLKPVEDTEPTIVPEEPTITTTPTTDANLGIPTKTSWYDILKSLFSHK